MGTTCCRQPVAQTPTLTHSRKNSRQLVSEMSQAEGTSKLTSYSSFVSSVSSKLIYKGEVLDAVSRKDLKVVQQFLTIGFPVNTDLNESGWSMLHVAAHNGDLPMLEYLLKQGASINQRDFEEHWTPVMAAAMSDHSHAVKLLEAAGADMTLKDCHGRTASELAKIYRCNNVKALWSEL